MLKSSGWPGRLLLTAQLLCWFCTTAVSRERWRSRPWDAKGIGTGLGEEGFPGLELFAPGLGDGSDTEKKLKAKEGKCPEEKSCLGAARVLLPAESCSARGHGSSDVRNPKSLIPVRLNASANKRCLTLGQEVPKVECVCVCCRGHLIPLSFGKAESPWGPADNTWYIDVLITALCFQPEFAFYPILIS